MTGGGGRLGLTNLLISVKQALGALRRDTTDAMHLGTAAGDAATVPPLDCPV